MKFLPRTETSQKVCDRLSTHAQERVIERNVDPDAMRLLMQHGDLNQPSRGCSRRRLSRGTGRRIERLGLADRRTIERAREMEAIVGGDGCIVTVWRLAPDLRFRRSGRFPSCRRQQRISED